MKNVLILLQLILTVQPRGLDPNVFSKDARANLSAEDFSESLSEPANDSYEFAFINNFLSSENVMKDLSQESNHDKDNEHGDRKKVHETNLKVKEGLEAKGDSKEDHSRDYSVLFGRGGAGSETSRYNAGRRGKDQRGGHFPQQDVTGHVHVHIPQVTIRTEGGSEVYL